MKYWATFLLIFSVTAPAHADWYEASSDHFVIYADDSEKDVRRFAEMLEKYHASMEYITSQEITKPSPSNRVTIFAVGSQREIRKLSGSDSRHIAGFYVPRAGGSKAFVQDIRLTRGYPDFSTIILLHEYAHHFLISSSRYAMPRWMSEGAAEFFASASFNSDGTVQIGRPALHRAGELAFATDVSVDELLDQQLYEKTKGSRFDAFYGRSWLLYHYLTFDESRRGQLSDYGRRIVAGSSSPEAGREAFGDFDVLEKDLSKYLRSRRLMNFHLKAELLQYGEVSVRQLSKGEAAMMPVRIRSQRGVNEEEAAELLPDAQAIAAKYPNDAAVLTALAEAEFDAGNDASAIVAANAAIAIDPSKPNAYVQKGLALFRMAGDAADEDAAYRVAMEPFTQLNAMENDHPLPLIYYYRSYTERGKTPPEGARHALERASQLAMFDKSLRMNVALMQALEGKTALAAHTLGPLATDPHGGQDAEMASTLITALNNAEEGAPFDAAVVFREAPSVSAGDNDTTGED